MKKSITHFDLDRHLLRSPPPPFRYPSQGTAMATRRLPGCTEDHPHEEREAMKPITTMTVGSVRWDDAGRQHILTASGPIRDVATSTVNRSLRPHGTRQESEEIRWGSWIIPCATLRVLRGIIFGKSLLGSQNLGLHMLLKDLGILSNKRQSLL
ncbi:hypothetical protein BHE74_00024416 [Ensete ventricosum]|nr:hypothetical protein BHE74_00024416 [Ensete ventricosum]